MHRITAQLLATGLFVFLATSCSSPAEENSDTETSRPNATFTFGWTAPARINVVESFSLEQKEMKVRYDVTLSAYGPNSEQLLLTTSNLTPIEFEGEQVNTSTLPSEIRQNIRSFLVDYHARPQLVISAEGEFVRVEGVENSIATIADIGGVEDKQAFIASALNNPLVVQRVESLAINVWDCWVSNWEKFEAPFDDTLEQNIEMVVFVGADPVPGIRTLIHHGFADDSNTDIYLEQRSVTEGTPLAQAMMNSVTKTSNEINGLDVPVPNVSGIVTAKSVVKQKVKMDPLTMRPSWAECSREFSIDSRDQQVLPSRSDSKAHEYRFQWLK